MASRRSSSRLDPLIGMSSSSSRRSSSNRDTNRANEGMRTSSNTLSPLGSDVRVGSSWSNASGSRVDSSSELKAAATKASSAGALETGKGGLCRWDSSLKIAILSNMRVMDSVKSITDLIWSLVSFRRVRIAAAAVSLLFTEPLLLTISASKRLLAADRHTPATSTTRIISPPTDTSSQWSSNRSPTYSNGATAAVQRDCWLLAETIIPSDAEGGFLQRKQLDVKS
mmetsp:Transcript_28094/g.38639  ORF Transcript_28094/g.38639 Transcript_28094/m.38639 type:complete len:226 (+) Transcript_28094:179-856(+)